MASEKSSADAKRTLPWDFQPQALLSQARAIIPYDAAAVGVVTLPHAHLDEFLATVNCPPDELIHWCDAGITADRLCEVARTSGVAVGHANDQGDAAPTGPGQVMVVMAPHSLADKSWWWFNAARRKGTFTPGEQRLGECLLRQWQVQLGQLSEPDIQRFFLGHDDRLIVGDPWTDAHFQREPNFLADLLEQFHPAVRQRWPNLEDAQRHDLFLQIAQKVYWVVFHAGRAVDRTEAGHWYLELRPSTADEMLPLGVVEDERIAQAVAYLHDHYHCAPSLAQIAEVVHISPFHFHRLFTRQVGLSPKHYLQRKQLQVARWLLRTSRTPVGEIAARIGFASHGHFTSTFHRIVGASPTDYREQN